MKNKTITLVLLVFLASSCRSKKTITEFKEVVRIDTLEIIKEREIVKRFTDTLTIESPCDSLGNLKPFKQVISTTQGKVSIQSNNGNITAKIDLKEHINEKFNERKVSVKENNEIKKEVIIKYRIPLWIWLIIGLQSLVIFLLIKQRFF